MVFIAWNVRKAHVLMKQGLVWATELQICQARLVMSSLQNLDELVGEPYIRKAATMPQESSQLFRQNGAKRAPREPKKPI